MQKKHAKPPGTKLVRKKSNRLSATTPKSDATKGMIVAAARKVFTRHPYHKASIRMIAREGGFHFSLINHYFTKSELFGAVVSQVCQELIDNFTSWIKGIQKIPPEEGLSLFLDRTLDHFFSNPDVLLILMKNAGEADSEETKAAFEYFSKYLFTSSGILINELQMEKKIDNMFVWFYGLLNLLITFVGAAPYHCQVLNMKPHGDEFRKWIKNCIMYIFTPTLKELFPVRHTD